MFPKAFLTQLERATTFADLPRNWGFSVLKLESYANY